MIERPNFTTVPNVFIEHYMYTLEKSSVLVFLAVCRKTLGYHKDTDYLSYSQLEKLTGLSTGGIAKALKQLEEVDLISVERGGGKTNKITLNLEPFQPIESEVTSLPSSGVTSMTSLLGREVTSLPSRETKEKENKEELASASTAAPSASPSSAIPFPKPTKEDRDPRVKKLIQYFAAGFQKRCGFSPTIHWPAWGGIFKALLRECDLETIEAVIDAFFANEKRLRLTVYDLQREFDNVYGYLYRKVHGGRRLG